jgi:copper chaperone NosL
LPEGKIYKYDSAECLFSILAESSPNEYGYIMVTDFTSPKTLVDATRAIYLISPKRPSPMGGNLSAYAYMSTAQSAHDALGGSLLDFDEVLAKYKALR